MTRKSTKLLSAIHNSYGFVIKNLNFELQDEMSELWIYLHENTIYDYPPYEEINLDAFLYNKPYPYLSKLKNKKLYKLYSDYVRLKSNFRNHLIKKYRLRMSIEYTRYRCQLNEDHVG